ncbi:endonuclease I family protein [Dysgonomonas sp. 520]|uniref:endonuclease I family protein n=1 Tax=Dysgonomonas sp. 520 TaxID=2302931 RepID=UPI0013D0B0CD|nr:endonuclease [Dysgonomonas sp. 520]NDW09917.1 hypothetical protein [Dysgonomonas sp. 520]
MAKNRKKSKKNRKTKIFLGILTAIFAIFLTFFYGKNLLPAYHKNLDGLNAASLKTALHKRIRSHKTLDFSDNTSARYWWDNYFVKTDWHPDGYFWDMYSDNKHETYIGGDLQNREHCMPRSWWGTKDKYSSFDANGDLHNLFPSDYKANSAKANFPLGEVGIAKFDNNSSKVGQNTYPNGYKGMVFEPSDEYKGDFARIYFYMITCYEDYAWHWRNDATKSMLSNERYPGLQLWAQDMLLKWHRQDPVSEKERRRNSEVFKIQHNRNPFVDEPELVEYIWGNKKHLAYNLPESEKEEINYTYTKDEVAYYLSQAKEKIGILISRFAK